MNSRPSKYTEVHSLSALIWMLWLYNLVFFAQASLFGYKNKLMDRAKDQANTWRSLSEFQVSIPGLRTSNIPHGKSQIKIHQMGLFASIHARRWACCRVSCAVWAEPTMASCLSSEGGHDKASLAACSDSRAVKVRDGGGGAPSSSVT